MWHLAADRALKALAGEVLNHQRVCPLVYRELSLTTLIGLLGRCPNNALVIGQHYSWLINAATCHHNHFVGSRIVRGLTYSANNILAWDKLHDFAARFAAPGTAVSVYCLHNTKVTPRPVARFTKAPEALFQPPGCNGQNSNGVRLYHFIRAPISNHDIDPNWLEGWEEAVAATREYLRQASVE